MTGEEALNYLKSLETFGFNFGLARINQLLELLGRPQDKLRFVHIGGTNGKGSTAVMTAKIMEQAGYKVGLFTSPHVERYTERIQINGGEIPLHRLAEIVTRLKALMEDMVSQGFEHPTEFEACTACALEYFAAEEAELVVLEVGLGGAVDSTNAVRPLVSVITNVALDHMDYLGDTVAKIATVKAGIVKSGVPLVTAAEDEEVLAVFKDKTRAAGSELLVLGRDFQVCIESLSAGGVTITVQGLQGVYRELFVPLPGRHQAKNAALAVVATELLTRFGYQLSLENLRRGLQSVRWPARLETVGRRPLVVLDAAHNVAGATTLAESLTLYQYQRLILVMGMLADKERFQVAEILVPLAHKVIVTRPLNIRAGNWRELYQKAGEFCDDTEAVEDLEEAVELALMAAGAEDLVVFTGSFYVVSKVRELLLQAKKC